MRDGLNTFCISCHKADNVARKLVKRADEAFRKTELEYKKTYRDRTVEERAAYMLEWRLKNEEAIVEYSKKYREENKAHYNFLSQKRKIDILQRTPSWLTADDFWMIEQAYELAALRTQIYGSSWHVDHVIPLRGKLVSGFHSPLNLQVIPAAHNQRKTNKFEV
jgi:hypothetical protein